MKDPCIRRLLRETELRHFIKDRSSKVVEELSLPVAKARIDMAVVNGHLHGYEIKSASDTLNRLSNQIEAYSKVFDYLSVVTETKYCEKVIKSIPSWVGIVVCKEENGKPIVEQIRKPLFNTLKEGFFLAKLLWRDELIDVLQTHDIKFKKKDRNWLLCEQLAANMDVESISQLVREILKNRVDWKPFIPIVDYVQ